MARSAQLEDRSELPDQRLLRAELNAELERALRELPETYRPVVLLRDVEGLSRAETAEIVDLSVDVVKQRLHRGRLVLRKSLAKYLGGNGEVNRK